MDFISDITYAISKKVSKDNKDTVIGNIAIVIMGVATILKLISLFSSEEE